MTVSTNFKQMKNKIFAILLFLVSIMIHAQDNPLLRAQVALDYKEYDSVFFYLADADSDNKEAVCLQAEAAFMKKEYEQSIQYLSAIGGYKESLLIMARAYAQLNNAEEACKMLDLYLRGKDKVEKHSILLDTLFDPIKESRELSELWKTEYYSPLELTLAAIDMKVKLGKEIEAMDSVYSLSEQYPGESSIYYYKARILYLTDNNKQAADAAETALRIEKKTEYYRLYAEILTALKKYDKAKDVYRKIRNTDSLQYVFPYAVACIRSKDYTEAVNMLKLYTSYYYRNDSAFYYLAAAHFMNGSNTKALLAVNQALKLSSKHDIYFTTRAEIYMETGLAEFAEKDYSMALDIAPTMDNYYSRAMCREKRGNKRGACLDYQKALRSGKIEAQYKINELCGNK